MAVVLVAAGALWWFGRHQPEPARDEPVAYVPNAACVECHEAQAKAWSTSHHAHAMAPASADSVLGSFDGSEVRHDDVTTRFLRRDGKFVVHTDGPDGTPGDFDVAYTFGVDPLQQYLLALPGGRLQALTIAWDTRRKRWFDLQPDEKTPPGDVLHWTGRYQSWNTMCASCHSTNLVKGYDAASDAFHTTWSETPVTCQSCHGPGARHVAWARAKSSGDDGLVPIASSAAREIETCAPCHARRSELSATPIPGAPLYDGYLPALLTEGLYYADGQQEGEVYVYGSFRQSRMYQAGVRCSDCHAPHSTTLRAEGNALCVRCHQATPDTTVFPGLVAKTYDTPEHHFHAPGSPGAQCVACHMPERNYMIIDARRDHAIRVPRPDLTVKIGAPNACTACHTERDAQWAADAVVRWYGLAQSQKPHYGEAIAAARAGRPGGRTGLERIVVDARQPAIVRATAIDLLGRYPGANVSAIAAATRDADPAVRVAAVGSLEQIPAPQRVGLVAPALGDARRAVRIEAARVLSSATGTLDPAQRAAYDAAMAEYKSAQAINLDMPGSHLNLAVVSERDPVHAEASYRAALRLDPAFTPARLNLARLLGELGRQGDAATVLREGIDRVPTEGELHYSLGLVLAESGNLAEAATALGRAAELLPGRARVQYNHALALQQLGRRGDAEQAFGRALTLDPGDPAITYAVAVFYAQQQNWPRALALADRLAELAPGDAAAQRFIAELRRTASADVTSP